MFLQANICGTSTSDIDDSRQLVTVLRLKPGVPPRIVGFAFPVELQQTIQGSLALVELILGVLGYAAFLELQEAQLTTDPCHDTCRILVLGRLLFR
jgi:hypothetical protein